MSNSKRITDFFKKTTAFNNFLEEHVTKPRNIANEFVKTCLQEETSECKVEKCVQLKYRLKLQLQEIQAKYYQHEDALKVCKLVIEQKEIEIDDLKKMIPEKPTKTGELNANPNANESEANPNASESVSKPNPLRFSQFSNDFTDEMLAKLREINLTYHDDSKFVSSVMKFMYENRLSCLKSKSVTGRTTKKDNNKEKLTPEKMNILEKIYTERIDESTINDFERKTRKQKLNKFVKDAIFNISKSIQSKDLENEACRRLEFE